MSFLSFHELLLLRVVRSSSLNHRVNLDVSHVLLTDFPLLVPIPISLLREELLAVFAGVGSLAQVRPHVVLQVAHFCELFVAQIATQDLV